MVKRKVPEREAALDLFGVARPPEETRAERIARIVASCHPCGAGCGRILLPLEGMLVNDFRQAICYGCQLLYGYREPNKHDRAKYENRNGGWVRLDH